jgi:hypothetical protein
MDKPAVRLKSGPKPRSSSLRQRAIAVGKPYHAVWQRVNVFGWSEDDALTVPLLASGKRRVKV